MRRIQQGFSLVELMIVVAIIGILAAIAIPNFITMQNKAKRAEVPGNVDGIKTAELAYDAAFDGYIALATNPTGTLGKAQVQWGTPPAEWSSVGWSPDGDVRGQYTAELAITNCPLDTNAYAGGVDTFCIIGTADVDGNGVPVVYQATPLMNAKVSAGQEGVY